MRYADDEGLSVPGGREHDWRMVRRETREYPWTSGVVCGRDVEERREGG